MNSVTQRPVQEALLGRSVGFIAGLTSETVFGKLLRIDVVHVSGIDATQGKA